VAITILVGDVKEKEIMREKVFSEDEREEGRD